MTASRSLLQPELQQEQIEEMKKFMLSEEFVNNYKICKTTDEKKVDHTVDDKIGWIGIWDLVEEKKADVIYQNNKNLQQWFAAADRKEAFVYNIATITSFFEKDVLAVYRQCGTNSNIAYYEGVGIYHSRALRYAIAKRNDIYENVMKYGTAHYINVCEKEVENCLQDLLKISLHLALLREENREKGIYDPVNDELQIRDPVFQFIRIISNK